jgi:hypothetical protein
MSGYNDILKIRRFEQIVAKYGLRLAYPKYRNSSDRDMVALLPVDDCLPIYVRDAELFSGTIDDALNWMQGIEWARNYDEMLRLSTNPRRLRKEQDLRNRQLMQKLTESKE